MLALYSCSQGEIEQCEAYLRAGYLLGSKMMKRSINTIATSGLSIRQGVLEAMLLLNEKGILKLKDSDLYALIEKEQFDPEKFCKESLLMDYWHGKALLSEAEKEYGIFAKIGLFDKKETLKMLQVVTRWAIQDDYFFPHISEWANYMDYRLFAEKGLFIP